MTVLIRRNSNTVNASHNGKMNLKYNNVQNKTVCSYQKLSLMRNDDRELNAPRWF